MARLLVRPACLLLMFILAVAAIALPDHKLALLSDLQKYPAILVIKTPEQTIERVTYCKTVIDGIDEAGIAVGENDLLSLPESTILQPSKRYEVTLTRMGQVTLNWSGFALATTGDFKSMDDLMSRSGFSDLDLSDGSRILKNQSESTAENGDLALIYVSVDKVMTRQYETIPFSTITVDDASLYIGQSVVKTAGADGQRALIYENTYENDILISSVLTGTELVKEPVQKVVLKGTRKRIVYPAINYSTLRSTVRNSFNKISSLLNRNGSRDYQTFTDNGNGTITVDGMLYKYKSMKKRTITKYDGLDCCLKAGCHTPAINHNTFSGMPAQRGLVATYGYKVDGKYVSSALPMGTILFIEGYGLGVVADVHGASNNPDLIDVSYDAGEIRAGTANSGKYYSRVYVLSIP